MQSRDEPTLSKPCHTAKQPDQSQVTLCLFSVIHTLDRLSLHLPSLRLLLPLNLLLLLSPAVELRNAGVMQGPQIFLGSLVKQLTSTDHDFVRGSGVGSDHDQASKYQL